MSDHTTPTKTCTKCGRELPLSNFSRRNDAPSGFRRVCKECMTEYKRGWENENRGHVNDKSRTWRKNNPERYAITRGEWNKKNAVRRAETQREWNINNPDKAREYHHRRRTLKLEAEGTHTADDIRVQQDRQKGKCYYCHSDFGDNYHVDHIVPLSRGGSDDPDNLVITCEQCNKSKGNRLPHEWSKGGRLL